MLRVRNRRRLAIAILAVFAAVSGFVTLTALDEYTGADLLERAEKYFESATDYRLRLTAPSVSLSGELSFEKAEVFSGDRLLVSADMVVVRGLPRPLGNWTPEAIEAGRMAVSFDLSDRSSIMDTAQALSDLAEAAASFICVLPGNIAVTVSHKDVGDLRYVASSEKFVEKRILDLRPIDVADPVNWTFTISPDEVHLSSMFDGYDDPLAKALAAEWEAGLTGRADTEFRGGGWSVTWTRTGRMTSCSYAPDGLSVPDAAARFGVDIGADSLEVEIVSAGTTDGEVTELEVRVEYSAAEMTREQLSALAALAGLMGSTGSEDPGVYENVHIQGLFYLEEGRIRHIPHGQDALVWSEVGGEVIPLVSGRAEISLDEFLGRMEAVRKSFEAGAEAVEEEPVAVEEDKPEEEPEGP